MTFDGTWTDLDANIPRSAGGAVLPELWPLLVGRAALQQRGVDWSNTDVNYVDANYPTSASDLLTRLTGWDATAVSLASATPATLRSAVQAGQAVVALTYDGTAATPGVVPNHAYTVLGVTWEGGAWWVRLRNPWGRDFDPATRSTPMGLDDGIISLRWDQFAADFYAYATTV